MTVKIGVVLGSKDTDFSKDQHYSIEIRYFTALEKAGARAIPVTYNNIEEQIDELDGILLPGGDFSTPSCYYVEKSDNPYTDEGVWFDGFMAIGNYALLKDKPVLGICAGMQILSVLLGGKLKMGLENHRLEQNDILAHKVTINENSKLYDIFKSQEIMVNSIHREAVAQVSDKFNVTAIADDGTIEAIESKIHDFALGVQWHPECLLNLHEPEQMRLFKYFVDYCKNKKES
jgi:putative glutamine amidotransferase